MTVPYSDNILVANEPVDYQLIALRLAMERMKILYPSRFKVLYEFYFAARQQHLLFLKNSVK
jgi:hypothetical protein